MPDDFGIDLNRLSKFEVSADTPGNEGKGAGSGEGGEVDSQVVQKDAKELAAEATAKAAAGGGEQEGKGAGEAAQEKEPDFSLLEGADEQLVNNLETVLSKGEDELTEEEQTLITDNEDLVRAIVNKDVTLVSQLMEAENYLQEGSFEDNVEGVQGYLEARDGLRDKQTIEAFLEDRPEVKAFYDHVEVNKNPAATYFARQNKPAILDTKIEKITDSMTDDQKKAITSVHETVVRANLKNNGMDDSIIAGVIETAKANNTLEPMAETSLSSMNKSYNNRVEATEKAFKDQEQARVDAEKEEIDKAVNIVKKGKILDNFIVPKSDEANFVKFISTPINNKRETMADKKYNELTLAQRTAIDYIIYKDFKLPSNSRSTVADRFKAGKKGNDTRQKTFNRKGSSSKEGFTSTITRENMAREQGFIS